MAQPSPVIKTITMHQSLAQMCSPQEKLKFFSFWQFVQVKLVTTSVIGRQTSRDTELTHCLQVCP